MTHAKTLFEAKKTDLFTSLFSLASKNKKTRLIVRQAKDLFSRDFFLVRENRELLKIPLSLHARLESSFQGNIILKLEKSWTWREQNYSSGSLLIVNPDKLIEKEPSAVQLLMGSTPERTLNYARASKHSIYINLLKDVTSSIVELKPEGKFWKKKHLALPSFSRADIVYSDPRESDVFFTAKGFLESPKLYHYNDLSGQLRKFQELSPRFDPSPYEVKQLFAKSFDGTSIPYFIVSKKNLKQNGKNPVLLKAYGRFSINSLPFYSPMQEFAWYREGGVFVLANIRGGGEYGPAWHQAGLKKNRQTVFNDFYAVVEDLTQRKITSPDYLALKGASNGGLLMGVAVTQKPDLFQAVLIKNPLLDMLRYHKLSIGSSWIAEYGDPEDSEMHKFISSYSPYQNLKSNKNYPEIFLLSSSLDDRVHPGHARRFARKLEKLNQPFYYYENTEGGHAGASNYEQKAILSALQYIHLYKNLME